MTGSVTGFHPQNGTLTCDGLSLADIADTHGTPAYVYSARLIEERYRALDAAFSGVPHRIHYAMKANGTLAIVRTIRALGASIDTNSGGELEVALRAGYGPSEIVFTGVGKTTDELTRAINLGIAAINAESIGEVERIAALAGRAGRVARVALRINPDVDAGSHPHISTGSHGTKFGVPIADLRAMIHRVMAHPELRLVGLHVHIGSQITTAEPIAAAARRIADLARDLLALGAPLEHLDLGGGLGVAYKPDQPVLTPDEYAAAMLPAIQSVGLPLLLEPGRWLVAPAGVLVATVVDMKQRPDGGWFVIVDAGMTDLMRPMLYGAWHAIEAVSPRAGAPILADIVGPVCETTDTLGVGRLLPPVDVGDRIAIRDAGAYGSVMASNYNRRPTAAEVLVQAGTARLIRRRQTVEDMLQWET
jgi:diaminopimelate decarboxylase